MDLYEFKLGLIFITHLFFCVNVENAIALRDENSTVYSTILSRMVAIMQEDGLNGLNVKYKCAGTLLKEIHVLTAAHCVINKDNSSGYFVVPQTNKFLSDNIENRSLVIDRWIHENYLKNKNGKCNSYDIAILKLQTAIPYTLPMTLGTSEFNSKAFLGKWNRKKVGNTTEFSFEIVRFEIYPSKKCKLAEKSAKFNYIHENICATAMEMVLLKQGDSGSPLVSIVHGEVELMGILYCSLRYSRITFLNNTYPAAFTSSFIHNEWIRNLINSHPENTTINATTPKSTISKLGKLTSIFTLLTAGCFPFIFVIIAVKRFLNKPEQHRLPESVPMHDLS